MTIRIAATLLLAAATKLSAQTTYFGDHSIIGNLCAGYSCTGSEDFGNNDTLKLRFETNAILFDDISTGAGYPNGDWRLRANDAAQFGDSYFSLEDADGSGAVLKVADGARASALHIDSNGAVGFGTALPGAALHMVSGNTPALRLDQDGSGGNTPQTWQIGGNHTAFRLQDLTAATVPLSIQPGAPSHAFTLDTAGRLGLGTATPNAALHIHSLSGTARARIEDTGATSPRTLIELINNGRPEIVMGNSFTGGEWSFGAGTNFILKQGAVGSASSAKTKLFEVQPTGDAILAGTLTTGGPTCTGGCDAVFSETYARANQSDYARQMWAQGYLPHVGPTAPGAPLDITEKLGGMLNALEHAHIYIDEQARVIAAQDNRLAEMRAELVRLSTLETRLSVIEMILARH